MKGFTNVLLSLLLVVVGGWIVVGMQEGQKLYQQHLQDAADIRAVKAERDRYSALADEVQVELRDAKEQFAGAQRIIADMGDQLTLAKSQIGTLLADGERKDREITAARADQKRLGDDYKSLCEALDRLRAERDVLAAQ
jgi:hypothetical protein